MTIHEQGVTLPELLVVLLVAGLLLTAGFTYSLPWLGREDVRSAAYEVQSHLQLARIQAIARNHQCLFLVDTSIRRIQVIDLNDPANSLDDIVLADVSLPDHILFTRPGGGAPITLASISPSAYQATYASDGSVSAGSGEIVLLGGDRYVKVSLYGAGGVKVEHWTGAAWTLGA